MLRHVGRHDLADRLTTAIDKTLRIDGVRTGDLGGKANTEGLTRALAREVASRGVTVNAVAPGFVDTDMTAGLPHDVRADHLAAIPMGRWAISEEIVAPVLFLASAGASYITGTVLGVDGGLGMGR